MQALTATRGIAALWVVLFHVAPAAWRATPVVGAIIQAGFLGVPYFFLLSGFILARRYGSAAGGTIDWRAFARARFARIYPVFFLSLGLTFPGLVAAWHGLPPGTVAATLLLVQAWDPRMLWAWNPPAWSLSAEVAFSVAFPWLIRWLADATAGARARVLVALVVLAGLLGAVQGWPSFVRDSTSFTVVFGNPLMWAPEFAAGVLLGLATGRGADWIGSHKWLPAGAIVVSLAAAGVSPVMSTALWWARPLLLVMWAGAILHLRSDTGYGLLRSGWAVRLGEASYALYLLHVGMFVIAKTAVAKWSGVAAESGWFALAFVAFAVAVAVVVHKAFEQPLRRILNQPWRLRPRTPAAGAPLITAEPMGQP